MSGDRLVSWKRIAGYMQRGERTVRRWAVEEELPVHRVNPDRGSSVFALKSELDEWLSSRDRRKRPKQSADRKMLAVLPFEDLSDDAGFGNAIDGITEEAISVLGRCRGLGVIARTSVMGYKQTRQSVADIGRDLKVQYVIEGSVRREVNRVRLNVQLIDVADQSHLWAESYDHRLDSVLAMQQALAIRMARDVRRVLAVDVPEHTPSEIPSEKSPAEDAYLEGRYLLWRMTPESITQSISTFDRAIALDPVHGPAFGAKAEALALLTTFTSTAPASVMPEAVQAINRAVALDTDSAEVFASLGFIHCMYTWDWVASEQAFRRAIRLNPSLSLAHQWFAEMLATSGRFPEALEHAEEARQLDPLSLAVETSRGHVLWLAGRNEELIEAMTRVIAMEPNYPLSHIHLINAHLTLGDFESALAASRRALKETSHVYFRMFEAIAEGSLGRVEKVDAHIAALEQLAKTGFVSAFMFGMLHFSVRRDEEAIRCFAAAADERVWHVTMLSQWSYFDPLRSDSRFQAVLQQTGLS